MALSLSPDVYVRAGIPADAVAAALSAIPVPAHEMMSAYALALHADNARARKVLDQLRRGILTDGDAMSELLLIARTRVTY